MPSKRNGAIAYATEAGLRAVETSVQALDSRVQTLDSTVQTLDSRVQALDSRVQTLDSRVQAVEVRITQVESRLDHRITQVESRLDARITQVESNLRDEIHFVGALVEQLDSKMKVYVEGARSDIESLKARWAEIALDAETRVSDLEDVVRRSSRSLRVIEKELTSVRADIARQRESMNSVRDDLVKWGFGDGELPPIVAEHNARFDELERRLAALEARIR